MRRMRGLAAFLALAVQACSPAAIRSVWELRMPLPNTLKGDGVEILEVGGVRAAPQRSLNIGEVRVIGFALRPLVPTGFLFADGNEWIAAAETSVVGSFHIRSDVEVRERRAIIAASAALLLRESVGTPDEG